MRRRKIVGIGTVVVVLFVFGFSQLQAQSSLTLEGLSGRITTLTRRVSSLSSNKADRSEVRALETRVSALEIRLGDATPVSTATRRPTLTPDSSSVYFYTHSNPPNRNINARNPIHYRHAIHEYSGRPWHQL